MIDVMSFALGLIVGLICAAVEGYIFFDEQDKEKGFFEGQIRRREEMLRVKDITIRKQNREVAKLKREIADLKRGILEDDGK